MQKVLLLFFAIIFNVESSPPDPSKLIETFEIDLDLPPKQRWAKVVKEKHAQAKLLLSILKPVFEKFPVTNELIAATNATLPSDYVLEMQGIADMVEDVSFSDVLMANLFYEITGVADTPFDLSRSCTSIVAQRDNGTVYLARNQDYPPPFTLVMIHTIFTKGGKKLYEGTTYAGTIGLSTASVPGGWDVSINARGNSLCSKSRDACQKAAVAAAGNGAAIFPIFTRQAADNVGASYEDAKDFFTERELIMPGYIIMGGTKPGEGAIVTRSPEGNETNVLSLFDKNGTDAGGGDWYVVQTNTDHWKPAPIYPNTNTSRRGCATAHMDKVGKKSIDLLQLWNVLDVNPVYNPATIHTDLVAPKWDEYRTYKRHGPL